MERERLAGLVAEVGTFHLRDRKLVAAQRAMAAALERGDTPQADAVRAYLRAVEWYFSGFAREARAHLRDVERRLAKVSQVQFNLAAERGVAARRIDLTEGVLAKLSELDAG